MLTNDTLNIDVIQITTLCTNYVYFYLHPKTFWRLGMLFDPILVTRSFFKNKNNVSHLCLIRQFVSLCPGDGVINRTGEEVVKDYGRSRWATRL